MEDSVSCTSNVNVCEDTQKTHTYTTKNESLRNIVKRANRDLVFPFLPTSMFQLVYDGKKKDENLKTKKYKCLIDGCSKIFCVSHNSRCNAKRHISVNHPQKMTDFVILVHEGKQKNKKILQNERKHMIEVNPLNPGDRSPNFKIPTQKEFDFTIMRIIVDRINPWSSQDIPMFSAFNNIFPSEFEFKTADFYNNLIAVQYRERKLDLIAALQNATWVSSTIDCWISYGKYYIGKTVQWYDNNLKQHQACLGVRKLVGKLDYTTLADYLYSIYKEFNIEKKIEVTVTDGGSNFIETLMLQSYLSRGDGIISEDSYDDDPDIILPSQDVTTGHSGLSFTCYKISVYDILHQIAPNKGGSSGTVFLHNLENKNSIPSYRQCAAQVLKIIISAKKDIEDKAYKRILYSTDKKITAICIKQFESYENSNFIESSIGCLFAIIDHTQWNSYFDRMNCFSKLLREKKEAMQSLFKALGLIWLRENEQEFIHEYVTVLQPVVDVVFLFNGEVPVPQSHLLPTLTLLRQTLESLQHDVNIKQANALVCSLLDSLENQFGHLYNIKELRVAAVCDPKFKVQWLRTEERETYRKLLQEVYDQWEMETNNEEIEDSGSEDVFGRYTSSTSSPPNNYNLNSFDEKKNGGEKKENEVDCYFADPLCDHKQLLKYPLLMKIFRKYNAVPSSSAFVERILKKVGTVFTSTPIHFPEKMLDMLIFLNINAKESCTW